MVLQNNNNNCAKIGLGDKGSEAFVGEPSTEVETRDIGKLEDAISS